MRSTFGLVALLAVAAPAAHAARPMITDDARVVDPKACQVESWVKRNKDSTELWALPACNPFGWFELTFGGGRVNADGESHFTDNVLQAKTIFRPLDERGWGIGLAVGTTRHPQRETANGWPGDSYFYVPLSVAANGEDWVLHFNAGMVHRRDDHSNLGTWGFGNEIRLAENTYFIPEVFRSATGRPFYQVGVRQWIIRDRMQVDATFGNRLVSDSAERWFSIGLRILSPPFIP